MTPIQLDDPRLAPIDAAARAFAGNVQEVGTGGGINAVLFDLANSTFSVFVDQELPGFAVQRHTSTDAFWNCQHGCRSVHVDDPAILAAYAPAALAVACPGTDDCTCDEMPS